MVATCWVNGCTNDVRSTTKLTKFGFYRIPSIRLHECELAKQLSEERRRLWLSRINRKEAPSKHSRICSEHFLSGKPSSLFDRNNPDWAPSLKLSGSLTPTKSAKKRKQAEVNKTRYIRTEERRKRKAKFESARALLLPDEIPEDEDKMDVALTSVDKVPCLFVKRGRMEIPFSNPKTADFQAEFQRLLSENMSLKLKVKTFSMTEEVLASRPDLVTYYTGLASFEVLKHVFDFIEPYLPISRCNEFGQFERLILSLARMKLNTPLQDLAYRFQTSTSTASRVFIVYIHVLHVRFSSLIYWPTRDELRKTMPMEFRKNFGEKTAVVIDCFEIPIQRPKNLMARAQTWSAYKHSNTVKFLIGITPQGSVSFLSKGWGGRASDKHITENCGIMKYLLPGDVILADRGFDIADSVGFYCAQINIPSFTRGKSQLSPIDVENTRKIAHVRIHVERVIGLVRNKYTILQSKLPIDILMTEKEELSVIDKIASVACSLANLCESVVPFN